MLSKDPNERMKIEDVLEHTWFSKVIKTKRTEERRNSKQGMQSTFKVYSSTSDI